MNLYIIVFSSIIYILSDLKHDTVMKILVFNYMKNALITYRFRKLFFNLTRNYLFPSIHFAFQFLVNGLTSAGLKHF